MEFTKEQTVYAEIVQKAWDDPQFKANLLTKPLETIEGVIGRKASLPTGKNLIVRDQTDESTVYINLPTVPNSDVELNEEQLEYVAGGATGPLYDAGHAVGDWIRGLFS